MLGCTTVLLVVFGLHLLPIDVWSQNPPKPFLYLRSSQNPAAIDADLDEAKRRLINAKPDLSDEKKQELESILSTLKQLPGKTQEEATVIFRKYSTQMYDFYIGLQEFVFQGKEPAIPTKFSEYTEILDDYDKRLLKTFGDIIKPEENILLACNAMYIERFANDESTGYKHANTAVLNCVFRQLVVDMATKMEMFNRETSQSIVKLFFMSSPEISASIYVNKYITGEYLALPLVMAEKMLQVLPRRPFAKVEIKKPDGAGAASTLLSSAVVVELQNTDLTVETVLGYTIKKLVKYYESLGSELFCKLKAKFMEAFGPHSTSGLAFAGSHVHSCIGKEHTPKKTKAKKQD